MRLTARWLAVCLVAAACGPDASADGAGGAPAPTLTLIEERRLDGMAESLTPVIDLAVSSTGMVAMAQSQRPHVLVLNEDLSPVTTVGRRGSGPGEFTVPTRVGWWAGETLWAHDEWQTRVSFFTIEEETEVVGGFRVPTQGVARAEVGGVREVSHLSLLHPFPDGGFLAYGAINRRWSSIVRNLPGDTLLDLVVLTWDTSEARTVRASDGSQTHAALLSNRPAEDISPSGRLVTIAYADLDAWTIDVTVVTISGDTVMAIQLPFDADPIPARYADSLVAARTQAVRRGSPALADLLEREAYVPDVFPPLDGVVLTDEGHVWLGLRPRAGGRVYWRLNAIGERVALLEVEESLRLREARGPFLWFTQRNEFGVDDIVRFRVEEPL